MNGRLATISLLTLLILAAFTFIPVWPAQATASDTHNFQTGGTSNCNEFTPLSDADCWTHETNPPFFSAGVPGALNTARLMRGSSPFGGTAIQDLDWVVGNFISGDQGGGGSGTTEWRTNGFDITTTDILFATGIGNQFSVQGNSVITVSSDLDNIVGTFSWSPASTLTMTGIGDIRGAGTLATFNAQGTITSLSLLRIGQGGTATVTGTLDMGTNNLVLGSSGGSGTLDVTTGTVTMDGETITNFLLSRGTDGDMTVTSFDDFNVVAGQLINVQFTVSVDDNFNDYYSDIVVGGLSSGKRFALYRNDVLIAIDETRDTQASFLQVNSAGWDLAGNVLRIDDAPSIGGGTTQPPSPLLSSNSEEYIKIEPVLSPLDRFWEIQCSVFQLTDVRPEAVGAILYIWDFGDGTKEITTAGNIIHQYETGKTYTGQVAIQDRSGAVQRFYFVIDTGLGCIVEQFLRTMLVPLIGLSVLISVAGLTVFRKYVGPVVRKWMKRVLLFGGVFLVIVVVLLTSLG